MKHAVLAILLTGVAGFIGLMGGVLIAAVVVPGLKSPPGPGGAIHTAMPWYASAIMVGLPLIGTVGGVIVGWVLILQMKSPLYQARHCSGCGYDLNRLTSDCCPECGAAVPAWQLDALQETDPPNA